MKKHFFCIPMLLALAACTHAPQNTQPQGSVKEQVLQFQADARQLEGKVMGTFQQGVTTQSLRKLDLNENMLTSLQKVRQEVLTLHPELQTAPVWLAEKSQLVNADQVGTVVDDVRGVFIFGTVAKDDPSKMAWVAQVVLDMDSETVVGYTVNPSLKGGYVPADHLVEFKDGEVPIFRRVSDGPQPQGADFRLKLVQYTTQGPTIITD